MKKDLIIIRHGRSQFNVHETDHPDSELTEFGRHQAAVVGKFINESDFWDYPIYTSPFLRCLQTTDIIFSYFKKSIKNIGWGVSVDSAPYVFSNLSEYLNDFGQGVLIPCRKDQFNYQHCGSWEEKTYKPESLESYMGRLHDAYLSLPDSAIVVTHGLPMLTLTEIAQGNLNYIPIWDYSVNNCSITRIVNGRVVWRGRNLHHEV